MTCHGRIGCHTPYVARWDVSHMGCVSDWGRAGLCCAICMLCHALCPGARHAMLGYVTQCLCHALDPCCAAVTHCWHHCDMEGVGVQTKSEALKREKNMTHHHCWRWDVIMERE